MSAAQGMERNDVVMRDIDGETDKDYEHKTSNSCKGEDEDLEFGDMSKKDFYELRDRGFKIQVVEWRDDYFDWVKNIDIKMKANNTRDSPQVGYCTAMLIDRERIRASFHRDIGAIFFDNTGALVSMVFNRWGCLRSEFMTHQTKKGTGVWGPELNKGRLLLIDFILIEKEYQRKGYGTKLLRHVWAKAQELALQEDKERSAAGGERLEKPQEQTSTIPKPNGKVSSGCDFAIVWGSFLEERADRIYAAKILPDLQKLTNHRKHIALEGFWKSIGFRRIGSSQFFCLARDPRHASHYVLPPNDYLMPPALLIHPCVNDLYFPSNIPDLIQQRRYNDGETRELLMACRRFRPDVSTWLRPDRHGNNILHVLAEKAMSYSLIWTLNHPFASALRRARNLWGETPSELLITQLEIERTWRHKDFEVVVNSDQFNGYTTAQVQCLGLLVGVKKGCQVPLALTRLKHGCTCGQCLGGFLSPRVAFVLESQAELNEGLLSEGIEAGVEDGEQWCSYWDHMFEHLDPTAKTKLQTDKLMQRGFTSILRFIGEALSRKQLPISRNVLAIIKDDEDEWPCISDFLSRSGTILAVLQSTFDNAMDNDIYLGDGHHYAHHQEEIDALPSCRNDGEFVFARRMCRRLEGLPDEVDPRDGLGGIW